MLFELAVLLLDETDDPVYTDVIPFLFHPTSAEFQAKMAADAAKKAAKKEAKAGTFLFNNRSSSLSLSCFRLHDTNHFFFFFTSRYQKRPKPRKRRRRKKRLRKRRRKRLVRDMARFDILIFCDTYSLLETHNQHSNWLSAKAAAKEEAKAEKEAAKEEKKEKKEKSAAP